MSDLIERLRANSWVMSCYARSDDLYAAMRDAMREAADALESQAKRIAELAQQQLEAATFNEAARLEVVSAYSRIAELEADNARSRVDAERWQAFLNCGRVKLFGWAGVNKKPGEPSYNEVGYVHFGGEFWTNAFEEKYYSAADKAQAQEVLIAFADGAIKTAQLAAKEQS